MTGAMGRSFFVAALFAVHPLHVESVAWVAERKDVLSTFFWFLSLLGYGFYARRGGVRWYLLAAAAFLLGLMAKPMLVTLPFVLLLLDWWPLARFQSGIPASRLVWEKVPFFFFSFIFCFVTYFAERQAGALPSLELLPLGQRAANALVAYVSYLGKLIWPMDLSVFYPYPGSWPLWQVAASGVVLAAITVMVVMLIRKHPYLFVGWFWYVGALVPVIGIVQVGPHAMADRYTYVPLIGLFIIAAWGAFYLAKRWRHGNLILLPSAAAFLAALLVMTWFQVALWKDSITLFGHAVAVNERNSLAHNVLGLALLDRGRMDEALQHASRAVEINPGDASALDSLGVVLARRGRAAEAMEYYGRALMIRPQYADALFNMGCALAYQGRFAEAIPFYRQALQVKPQFAKAQNNIGVAFASQGKMAEAIVHFREALRIYPNYVAARDNQALAGVRMAGGAGQREKRSGD